MIDGLVKQLCETNQCYGRKIGDWQKISIIIMSSVFVELCGTNYKQLLITILL